MRTRRKDPTTLIDCQGVKQVVLCRTYMGKPKPVTILDVIKETPTQLVVGRYGKETHRLVKREDRLTMRFGSSFDVVQIKPSEVKRAEKILAQEAAEAKAKRAEQDRIEADPHFQLVRRLSNGDCQPYNKLSLEKLLQIESWLDEVRE